MFFKLNENKTDLICAENFIKFSDGFLINFETKNTENPQRDDWYYFENKEDAYNYFGLEVPKVEDENEFNR